MFGNGISGQKTIRCTKPDDRGGCDCENYPNGQELYDRRRVARTRSMLQDALIALIPERGYALVTVEDICRKANVGRSTFYTHYTGKDELRSATIDAHLQSLTQEHELSTEPTCDRMFHFSLPMFEHAYAFRSLHHALLASSGDSIHDELRERIRRAVRHELAEKSLVEAGILTEFAVQFVSGAFLSVLAWWIVTNADLLPGHIDELFQRMAARGIGN